MTHCVIEADFWRLGQTRPGDTIRFRPVSHKQALNASSELETYLGQVTRFLGGHDEATITPPKVSSTPIESPDELDRLVTDSGTIRFQMVSSEMSSADRGRMANPG